MSKAHKKCRVASKRQDVNQLIDSFIAKTRQGPDYVCVSCHRLMYKQTVTSLNVQKYTKASHEMLQNVFSADNLHPSFGRKYWVCTTCNTALSHGVMPMQAICNGMKLSQIPVELACLNPLEVRLISLRDHL